MTHLRPSVAVFDIFQLFQNDYYNQESNRFLCTLVLIPGIEQLQQHDASTCTCCLINVTHLQLCTLYMYMYTVHVHVHVIQKCERL